MLKIGKLYFGWGASPVREPEHPLPRRPMVVCPTADVRDFMRRTYDDSNIIFVLPSTSDIYVHDRPSIVFLMEGVNPRGSIDGEGFLIDFLRARCDHVIIL